MTPFFLDETNIIREFYLAGTRHHDFCNNDCNKAIDIKIGEKFNLELDNHNKYDPNAVKVLKESGEFIGFIPVFYSEDISLAIKTNRDAKCTIKRIFKEKYCQECIKIELRIL